MSDITAAGTKSNETGLTYGRQNGQSRHLIQNTTQRLRMVETSDTPTRINTLIGVSENLIQNKGESHNNIEWLKDIFLILHRCQELAELFGVKNINLLNPNKTEDQDALIANFIKVLVSTHREMGNETEVSIDNAQEVAMKAIVHELGIGAIGHDGIFAAIQGGLQQLYANVDTVLSDIVIHIERALGSDGESLDPAYVDVSTINDRVTTALTGGSSLTIYADLIRKLGVKSEIATDGRIQTTTEVETFRICNNLRQLYPDIPQINDTRIIQTLPIIMWFTTMRMDLFRWETSNTPQDILVAIMTYDLCKSGTVRSITSDDKSQIIATMQDQYKTHLKDPNAAVWLDIKKKLGGAMSWVKIFIEDTLGDLFQNLRDNNTISLTIDELDSTIRRLLEENSDMSDSRGNTDVQSPHQNNNIIEINQEAPAKNVIVHNTRNDNTPPYVVCNQGTNTDRLSSRKGGDVLVSKNLRTITLSGGEARRIVIQGIGLEIISNNSSSTTSIHIPEGVLRINPLSAIVSFLPGKGEEPITIDLSFNIYEINKEEFSNMSKELRQEIENKIIAAITNLSKISFIKIQYSALPQFGLEPMYIVEYQGQTLYIKLDSISAYGYIVR